MRGGAQPTWSNGTSEAVTAIIGTNGAASIDAILDPTGARLGLSDGSSTNWTLFDPHGDLAAQVSTAGSIVRAYRYDPYGREVTTPAGGIASPWRYQGALDSSPDATDPLYDIGARTYAPSLGAWTALDTYAGTAADPRSLNRYLYAAANPATLIDPSGRFPVRCDVSKYDGCSSYSYIVGEGENRTSSSTKGHFNAPKQGTGGGSYTHEDSHVAPSTADGYTGWVPPSVATLDAMSPDDLASYVRSNAVYALTWEGGTDEEIAVSRLIIALYNGQIAESGLQFSTGAGLLTALSRDSLSQISLSLSSPHLVGAWTQVALGQRDPWGAGANAEVEGLNIYSPEGLTDDALRALGVGAAALAIIPVPAGTPLIRGASSGLDQFEHASKWGILPCNQLVKLKKGLGLDAHHLIERRFARALDVNPNTMISIALTKQEHQVFTNAWRKAFPYGKSANAPRDKIFAAAKEIYADYPEILAALSDSFKDFYGGMRP